MIKGFSEDVDVIVVLPGKTKGTDDRHLKDFVAAAETSTGLNSVVDSRTATKGVKRTAIFEYPTASSLGPLRRGVLLELGGRGGPRPTVQRQVTSLIVKHAAVLDGNTDFLEAVPLELKVLAPVRTLIEKLIIVHHAAVAGTAEEQARLASHYYDIWCLLEDSGTVAALDASPADELAQDIVSFSDAAGLPTSERPEAGFADSPAFDPNGNDDARSAFESIVLEQLVWSDAPRPTFDECCQTVAAHADRL